MDLVGFLRDWRRVGKAEVDMEVGAEVVEAKEEDEEEDEKKEKKEKKEKEKDHISHILWKIKKVPNYQSAIYGFILGSNSVLS